MKTILVFAAVLVASAAATEEGVKQFIDYRLAPSSGSFFRSLVQPRDVTCTSQGRICDEDCQRIWTCVSINGQLKPALLETCKVGQTCNNGNCSVTPSPECALGPGHEFVCQGEGVFPDPRTCKKYHYCITKETGGESGGGGEEGPATFAEVEYDDTERVCTRNRGYNPRTTYCDKVLINDQCGAEYPVPICKTSGQHAALKDNTSIFYVCSLYNNEAENVLYPYLYLCQNGEVYDGNFGCKAK